MNGFYHCSVKPVGRANGRSVVAAAAYRSGERLADERTGEVFDYRARGGVLDTFILTRDDAAAWRYDHAKLWNAAEQIEPRANGRLATELELALPHELTDAQRKRLVMDFLAPIIARHGVAADVAIHEPGEGRDHRNIHAHVLLTHRELGPDGFGEIANRRMTTKKVKGQEKQIEIAGVAATPADIKAIRKAWEQQVNRAYEREGFQIQVDCRSHEDRGIEQEPSKHLGPSAAAIERRGIASERGDLNRDIAQRNVDRRALKALDAEARKIAAAIIELETGREAADQRHAEGNRYDDLRATQQANAAERAACDLTRMYRGIGNNVGPAEPGDALFFSTDPAQAAVYGLVHYVDVTAAEMAKFESAASPSNPNDWRTADPAIIARLKPLEGQRTLEVIREFQAAAGRAAEPDAPIFDRDAVNRAADEKIIDAAIKQAASAGIAHDAMPAPSAFAHTTSDRQKEQRPEDTRLLGKTVGDIRMAWALSRTAEELEEALASRGITLALVGLQEAEQSRRTAAFAHEVGNYARGLNEGEIVAVNEYGNVYRLDTRATGVPLPEIEARLSGPFGIDRAGLLSLTDAKAAMQEAARASRADEAREQREMNKPLTGLETAIAEALAATMTGTEFADALDKAGITLTRATAADVLALDVLREDAKLAATVAYSVDTNLERDVRHYAVIAEGDYAAVTRKGDVFRLNPTALDFEEAEQRLADVQPRLPSVVEARAVNEIDRENKAAYWAELREWNTEARIERNQAFEGEQRLRRHVGAAEHAVETTLYSADDALSAGLKATGILARVAEAVLGSIFSFFVSGPKLTTPDQVMRAERAADQRAEANAVTAAEQQEQDIRDRLSEQQRSRDIARTQGMDVTGDPEEDRFRSIMQRAARDRDRDRENERER